MLKMAASPQDSPHLPRHEKVDMARPVRRLREQNRRNIGPFTTELSGGRYTGSIAILPVLRALNYKARPSLARDNDFERLGAEPDCAVVRSTG